MGDKAKDYEIRKKEAPVNNRKKTGK